MDNCDRIAVWEDTYNKFITEPNPNPPSQKFEFNTNFDPTSFKRFPITKVSINKYDIVDMALIEKHIYKQKVLLLNTTDMLKPGKYVEDGGGSQEECIFRRSNYFRHLSQKLYPVSGSDIILSKNVKIVKHSEEKGYTHRALSYMDIMAISAPKFPQLDDSLSKYANDEDRLIMEQKINSMFKLGCIEKYDVLVLSDFGCDTYGNPIDEVVEIFNETIKKYKGCFGKIVFAVLGDNYRNFKSLKDIYY